jgi:hypothetical protein
MKIEVKSTFPISDYYLESLSGERINFLLGKEIDIPSDWYQLNIPYTGQKNDINEIILDDVNIDEQIYTGYYVDGKSKVHQPGGALWDEGGCFKIWLHSKIGVFVERIMRCLESGEYGSDLSKKYLFTVDKPLEISKSFPKEIQSFFSVGKGPYWWDKSKTDVPYRVVPNLDFDKEAVLEEAKKLCVIGKESEDGGVYGKFRVESTNAKCNLDLPYAEFDPIKFPVLNRLFDAIGLEKLMTMHVSTLEPGGNFTVHRDRGYFRDGYNYLTGCKIFYWNLTNTKDNYFKFGRCGLLPTNEPLFVNTLAHVHSAINQSTSDRKVLIIAGKYHENNFDRF